MPYNRYKTAISRIDHSHPIRIALADGLFTPGVTVLDFGGGLGGDVRHLGPKGIEAWGWDPTHRPDGDLVPVEVVNLGYVVNVIEDIGERLFGGNGRRSSSILRRGGSSAIGAADNALPGRGPPV